jgi:hypothetical protein
VVSKYKFAKSDMMQLHLMISQNYCLPGPDRLMPLCSLRSSYGVLVLGVIGSEGEGDYRT